MLEMTSSWRRSIGNVRSFIGNSMGGLRGGTNLASWVVAGTLAYFLWVKPSQELKRQQQVLSISPNFYKFLCGCQIELVFFFFFSGKSSSSCSFRSLSLCWETKTHSWSSGINFPIFYFFWVIKIVTFIHVDFNSQWHC